MQGNKAESLFKIWTLFKRWKPAVFSSNKKYTNGICCTGTVLHTGTGTDTSKALRKYKFVRNLRLFSDAFAAQNPY
jgi:hypothetical protein